MAKPPAPLLPGMPATLTTAVIREPHPDCAMSVPQSACAERTRKTHSPIQFQNRRNIGIEEPSRFPEYVTSYPTAQREPPMFFSLSISLFTRTNLVDPALSSVPLSVPGKR